MLKNYFVVAIRSFVNHKVYTIINTLGLAIGIAAAVLIALFALIGVPVASFLMSNWMEGFAYQSGINWWLVSGSLGLIFAISLLAIDFNAVKASLQNPAMTLREE